MCGGERITPDDLFRETAVDGVDVLLKKGARLGVHLLHLLQPPAGHEQAASLTVIRQHLRSEEGRRHGRQRSGMTL